MKLKFQSRWASLGLLDDLLVQLQCLRVPLAEGGLGQEALGVGDGGGEAVAAVQARPGRQAPPARPAGTPSAAAPTTA